MTQIKSFEEMGREADKAVRDYALAKAYLANHTEETAAGLLSIAVYNAKWDNGTLALQSQLNDVVREQAGDLIFEALSRLERNGFDATESLRVAFERARPAHDLSRQRASQDSFADHLREGEGWPAEVEARLNANPEQAPPPAEGTATLEAPLPGQAQSLQASPVNPHATAWNALPREAQELLTWVAANPASKFARTPSRDVLVAGGYIEAKAGTYVLTRSGTAILPPA